MGRKPPLPPTYLLLSLVVMLGLHLRLPGRRIIDLPWRLLGILPLAVGVALNLMADRAFKRHRTTVKPFEESSALITSGVFAFTRHPMYLGFVMILLGAAMLMGSLFPLVVVALFPVVMEIVFVHTEEKMLGDTFGATWLAYKQQVRRWL